MSNKTPWIKAIDTEYNGMIFRSRLEARWAVFFDAAGIKYEYEPEGFEYHGYRYLPDFYLPELDTYAEVKPDRAGLEKDIIKSSRLIYWGGPIKRLVFLGNIPGPCKDGGLWHFPCIYYSTLDYECNGIETGWFYFADDYSTCADGKCYGKVSSSDYPGRWIISDEYVRRWGRDKATGDLHQYAPSMESVTDTMLGGGFGQNMINQGYSLEDAIEEQITYNKHTFAAYKEARCARFEFKRTHSK